MENAGRNRKPRGGVYRYMRPMAPSIAIKPNPKKSSVEFSTTFPNPTQKKIMKTKLQSVMWSMLLAAGLTAALPVVRAQDEGGEKPKKERAERPERPPGGGGPAQRLEMTRERLGLTDAQVEQLKPIFAAEREEVAAKRKELGKEADRAAVREAMQAIREKYRPQVEAVLTPEQLEKVAAARERGPGGPGGGEGKKPGKPGKGGKGGGEGMGPGGEG